MAGTLLYVSNNLTLTNGIEEERWKKDIHNKFCQTPKITAENEAMNFKTAQVCQRTL